MAKRQYAKAYPAPKGKEVINRTVDTYRIPTNKTLSAAQGTTIPWWSYTAAMLPSAVFAQCREFKTKWGLNYIDIVNDALRYSDRMYNTLFGQSPYIKTVPNQLLSLNVTASCIDTLVSKICKHTPMISYITQGGDWYLQQEAEKLQKFTSGLFQFKKIDRLTPQTFKDACVLGTGMIHIREHNVKKELVYEAVKSYEFVFDWNSGMNETISDFHILKFINRYDLAREYPDHAEDILATPTQNEMLTNAIVNTDVVICAYSYNFFSKRHTVSVVNKLLKDVEWNFEDMYGDPLMPVAIMRYEHDDRGFFGIGLSSKLKGVQNELNNLVRTAQMSTRLMAIPKVLVPRTADITKTAMDNSIGGLIYYNPPYEPKGLPLGPVPVDLFTQIDSFYRRGFEIAGISQLSAGSQKPVGIDSGKGLETMYQIESDRFQMLGKEFENLYIQLNDITLAFYEQLPQMSHKALVQTYYKQEEGEKLKFADINIERDMCYLKAYPISSLPSTPEGQFEQIFQWQQAGWIDLAKAKKLAKMPDTEGYLDFENSEYDFVMKQINKMVEGEAQEPVATQDPTFALMLSKQAYFYYSAKGLEDESLALINLYIQSCTRLMNKIQEAQNAAIAQQQQLQPPAGPVGPGPGIAPGAGPIPGPQPGPGGGALPQAA